VNNSIARNAAIVSQDGSLPCPFCAINERDCFLERPLAGAIWDRFPVSPGHALIISRRHVASWFEASIEERDALTSLIDAVRVEIERDHSPDGYNIGINIAAAAGQTVPHLHLHVIPRYEGDVPDPRGGVRYVIPQKANYLAAASTTGAPHGRALVRGATDPLLPHLIAHLDHAERVDIAVAFIMESGVRLVEEHLRDVLARGGSIRLLTGRYLGVTEPEALLRLLDLGERAEIRVFESGATSFHLKSYIVHATDGTGTAFVGSSNLSRSALREGVEWNYRVLTSRDGDGFRDIERGFEDLFSDLRAIAIDAEWVARYSASRQPALPSVTGISPEIVPPPPPPHDVQRAALAALANSRSRGDSAGLVVLATGLGKTWLSAFDTTAAGAKRVLFVAHREEILDQALRTYRTLRPGVVLGKYTGTERTPEADVLFASIQTLGRQRHLDRFPADHFDYIVVDEFHHASAETYRRLLDHFTPTFLLGLTATPERTDGADLLSLCGGNLVYRCDLAEGVRRGLLAPFDYFGVPDEVDYENIPWRSSRFDEEKLTEAVATQSRAQNVLEQLVRHGGKRTLAFCVSQRHAEFMKRFFEANGMRAAAVFAGPGSDPRAHSLERLRAGDLDVLCAVDMFNEGVDLPDIDTVMMLRPTESQILWLQQFGRGLRYRDGKRLKVIDYIGNHRSFLIKPRTLFALTGGDAEISYALRLIDGGRAGELLPPGCSVTYELEARDILRQLLEQRSRGGNALETYYREFRDRQGERPTAAEAFADGYDPKAARPLYGSWFQLVRTMGDLSEDEKQEESQLRTFLTMLEATPMTKSFKMLVLLAIIAEGAFPGEVSIAQLVERVQQLARRSVTLRTELGESLEDPIKLRLLLEQHPISAWVAGRGTGGESYFKYEKGSFGTTFSVSPGQHSVAARLVRELADWRLAVYLRRAGSLDGAPRIICKVSHSGGSPILFLPSRDRTPGVPESWVDVTANGQSYQANFVKIAVNVMHSAESPHNALPQVLRGWFGEGAGLPGSTHQVAFTREGDGYRLEPWRPESTSGPQPWVLYKRDEIPKLFGFAFKNGFESQVGVITRPGLILLVVTLDKSTMQKEHQYEDAFLSSTEFRWQSQNQTRRDSDAGKAISEHQADKVVIHLFVRSAGKVKGKTQPFAYAGELEFQRWEGDKPITVWWKMKSAVPQEHQQRLHVPTGPLG
jgi:superfamily II DNA or RNA helicase/diadenosine tetraphosphate (Ap4A) HIT family hydrolase